MTLLAILLLAHLCTDFLIQSDQMARCKRSTKLAVKWYPLLGHALTQVPVAIGIWLVGKLLRVPRWPSIEIFVISLIITVITHWLIDVTKQNCQPILKRALRLKTNQVPLISYIFDQLLHLLVIEMVSRLLMTNWQSTTMSRWLLAASVTLSTLYFADYFISLFLKSLDLNAERLPDRAQLGRHIGRLERLAILLLFYTNNVASIAVVVAIKALTRFRAIEANQQHFAEYYLIGSLLSLIFGCLGGCLLKLI
ncbi:DUF3307 domain-containing protein [Latilactobacillus fragifolii]|uniref:DUF3307 domain-containing protein n=1 Tax=Latilactobacillus fragifolii TaxID=2814244 RepID=UPI001ABB7D9B|nr:DUF3307 domain-containing protein [Latilactobacillus fragifolii]